MAHPQLEKFRLYLKLDCGLSPRTAEAYCGDLGAFLDSIRGNLASVSREHVQKHLDELARSGISTKSIARKLSALRSFFKLARAQGWSTHDPTDEIESPKVRRALPKTMSLEQVEELLAAPALAGNAADATMLRMLYASGLRVSELVSLAPEQVDTEAGLVRVLGKGEKVRIVPVDAETCQLITHYIKEIRPALRQKARAKQPAKEALFLSRQGRPFTRQGFWKLIKKYARAAGVPETVSPHVLRHAFATHLLERGMNLRSLQMLLGHSDISTTEIYSHVSTSHLHETLRKHHPRKG